MRKTFITTTCVALGLLGGSALAAGPEPMPTPPPETGPAEVDPLAAPAPDPMTTPAPAPDAAPAPEATTTASAETGAGATGSLAYQTATIDLGLKVGGAFSSVFNSLGAAFTPELEIGVLLPPMDQAFEIFLATRWAAPTDEGETEPDARLPGGGVASWEVTRHELSFGLGLRFRIPLESDLFRPYLAAGARMYLLRTEVSGSAGGEPFGTNEETGTAFGFLAQLGGEFYVGPGALVIELAVNGAALDQTILADTNTTSLDAYLGYRFFF